MKVIKIGDLWCSGCLIMGSRWEEIEKENLWLKTEYYDFDKDKDKIKKYDLKGNLPVFIFLDKKGKEFLRLFGEISRKELKKVVLKNKTK